MQNQRLLKVKQACDDRQFSKSFFYSEVRKGRIRLVKFGRASRVTEDEMERYVSERVKEAEAIPVSAARQAQ